MPPLGEPRGGSSLSHPPSRVTRTSGSRARKEEGLHHRSLSSSASARIAIPLGVALLAGAVLPAVILKTDGSVVPLATPAAAKSRVVHARAEPKHLRKPQARPPRATPRARPAATRAMPVAAAPRPTRVHRSAVRPRASAAGPNHVTRRQVLGAFRLAHRAAAKHGVTSHQRVQRARHAAKKALHASMRAQRKHVNARHTPKAHGRSSHAHGPEHHPGKGKK